MCFPVIFHIFSLCLLYPMTIPEVCIFSAPGKGSLSVTTISVPIGKDVTIDIFDAQYGRNCAKADVPSNKIASAVKKYFSFIGLIAYCLT